MGKVSKDFEELNKSSEKLKDNASRKRYAAGKLKGRAVYSKNTAQHK